MSLHGPVGDLPGVLAQMTIAVTPLDAGGGIAELARRPPYWLAEWRSRDPQPEDDAHMTEQTSLSDRAATDDTGLLAHPAVLGLIEDTTYQVMLGPATVEPVAHALAALLLP